MCSHSDRHPRHHLVLVAGCLCALLTHAVVTGCSRPAPSPPQLPASSPARVNLLRQAAMLGPARVDAITLPPMHATWSDRHILRVCADPNTLPFSNRAAQGFENRIASMVARDIGATVAYTWWPQRRGFARLTLRHGACDVIMGVPTGFDPAWTTAPYYRSRYVFVTRRDRALRIRSLDDPALRHLRIGVHTIGDDYANTPPAEALARRGVVTNLVGYPIYGDYSKPDPPADLLRAVARGDVDVAIVWGPIAGYFASRLGTPLQLTPVTPDVDPPALRFAFDIAAGVRHGDTATRTMLDRELARRRDDIHRLLGEYGIPYTAPATTAPPRGEGR